MKLVKLLAILFVTVLMFSNVSFGQNAIPSGTARFEALGSSPFILDASIDINNNPAWSSMYRNYAFGDIGRNTVDDFQLTDQFAAVNFGISKDLTLGLVLNKREDMWNNFLNDTTVFPSANVSQPIVPLKILFSWSNKSFSLGLAPYYTAWSLDAISTPTSGSTAEIKRSSSSLGATLGILALLNKSGWIEGAVDFKMNSFKQVTTGGLNETIDNQGGLQLSVMTRAFFQVDKKTDFNIVPYLGFGMYSWNPEVVPAPASTIYPKYSNINFAGGIGINFRVLEDGFLATGLSAGYSSYKIEQLNNVSSDQETFTSFILPKFNIGLEWNLTEWMQARLGYSRSVTSYKDKSEFSTGTFELTQSLASLADETISTGLGLQFSRFSFDGTIGENFFKQAPWIISGKSQTLFGVLSASYNFNR